MIIGIGADLCDIRRIEESIARFGDRFLERIFTAEERAKGQRMAPKAQGGTYAKRFAAKEACVKALGTGFNHGVVHSDIGVVNQPGGQPVLVLTGAAHERLLALMPPGATPHVALTMTDEYPYAFAQVIISARR